MSRPGTSSMWKALGAQAALFLLFLGICLYFLRSTELGRQVNQWMNLQVAESCAHLLRTLGIDGAAEGALLFTRSYLVVIVDECNGLLASSLLLAAALAFPLPWGYRLSGAMGALVFVALFNQARLASVMIVGSRWPRFVDTYEEVIIRAVHWIIALGLFWLWTKHGIGRAKHEILSSSRSLASDCPFRIAPRLLPKKPGAQGPGRGPEEAR